MDDGASSSARSRRLPISCSRVVPMALARVYCADTSKRKLISCQQLPVHHVGGCRRSHVRVGCRALLSHRSAVFVSHSRAGLGGDSQEVCATGPAQGIGLHRPLQGTRSGTQHPTPTAAGWWASRVHTPSLGCGYGDIPSGNIQSCMGALSERWILYGTKTSAEDGWCSLLIQDATDEGWVLVRHGGGSLDLKCYCLNAMTDEGMRVVSSLTVLWGCAKVTDERMRAVSSVTGLTSKRYNTPVGAEKRAVASPSTCRSYCEVRWAAEGAGSTTAFHRQSIVRKDPPALYPTEYSVAHEQC